MEQPVQAYEAPVTDVPVHATAAVSGVPQRNWPRLPTSVVKSAGRALQILEYFDDARREANMIDISRALHYPESSTSILLRSLVALGYARTSVLSGKSVSARVDIGGRRLIKTQ